MCTEKTGNHIVLSWGQTIPVQNNCLLYLSFCKLQPKFLNTQLSWCLSPRPLSQFCELMLSVKWQQQLKPAPWRKSKWKSGKEKIWRFLYFTFLVRLIPKHVHSKKKTDYTTKTWEVCPIHNITQMNAKQMDIADAWRPRQLQLRPWILLVSDNAQILHIMHL